ncbi:HD-GYP domain-containing protein [Streptomyces sp. NPDC046866]|uniref:HD-GYP domain-containing protein n=1 Tax=Streptomyces sp. NPDC046866 TaxID=3154921 RepID=UPI0034534C0D
MRELHPAARGLVLCTVLAACACTAPVFLEPAAAAAATGGTASARPSAVLLALLFLGCELARVCPLPGGRRAPEGTGPFFPVLLAAAFLLPPAAAALVAVPGALAGPAGRPPAAVRRAWHAAQQAVAAWAAGWTFALLGGPAALPGGPGQAAPGVADFPYALLPAAAAATVFSLVLTALDGAVLAAAERRPARTAWRGLLGRSLAPHCVHGLAGLMTAVLWRSPYGLPAALLVLLPMYVSAWVFGRYHHERAAHQATIRALVRAVDLKDRYTRGHGERVGQASVMIARELGMAGDRLETVRIAGILHDIGKLGVPTRLLRKAGPLTPQERRVIELHPEYGHEMVRGIGFLGEARSAILHHHERVDGSGYPYGLTGDQIPVLARVVAVADAFDAMTSTRSYSRARPVPAALAELERCAGTQFDPAMVRALVDAVGRHGWHPVAVGAAAEADLPPGAPGAGGPGAGPAAGPGPRPAPVTASGGAGAAPATAAGPAPLSGLPGMPAQGREAGRTAAAEGGDGP